MTQRIFPYRPICLFNVSFKKITKVGADKIAKVAQKTIKPAQQKCLPKRNIKPNQIVFTMKRYISYTKEKKWGDI